MNQIEENLKQLRKEIVPYTPNIIAVTKYFDENKIIEAYKAGLRDFGESRIPEAIDKINRLPEDVRKNSRFHLIGHLQSNKVKKAVGFFDYIHSVDSLKLAQVVSEEALSKNVVQKVLLQVNNANEEQKFGFLKDELRAEFVKIKAEKGLKIVGLMNMAPFGLTSDKLTELFRDIVNFRDELSKCFDCELKEISMGMSGDYKEAVAKGATMIRIGRKLFS